VAAPPPPVPRTDFVFGGEGGIRTHEPLAQPPVFKSEDSRASVSHSHVNAIIPGRLRRAAGPPWRLFRAECNLSATCCGHDALDWFAAIGPTAATLFTAWVALRVYQSGERIQRLLLRPRLGFIQGIKQPTPGGPLQWELRLRNHGQSPATVVNLIVLVDGTEIPWAPLENAGAYWGRVLNLLGLRAGPDFIGWELVLPENIGGGSEQPLVDGSVIGAPQAVQTVMTRIEVRVTYKSPFEERWVASSKTGETAA